MAYIYKIKNQINEKFYIGSTNDIDRRWNQHKYALRNNTHHSKHLQNSWNKYHEENFIFSIIEECEDKDQFKREQYFLNKLQPYNSSIGYNIVKLAQGGNFEQGEKHPNTSLTNNEVLMIKKLLSQDIKVTDISKELNIDEHIIYNIRDLRSWKYIGKQYNNILKQLVSKNTPLTNRELSIIKGMFNHGMSKEQISSILELSVKTVLYQYNLYIARQLGKTTFCNNCGIEFIKKSNNQKHCKDCNNVIKKHKSKSKEPANQRKNKELEDAKDLITHMYCFEKSTFQKILKKINICGVKNNDIKNKLKEWNITVKSSENKLNELEKKKKDFLELYSQNLSLEKIIYKLNIDNLNVSDINKKIKEWNVSKRQSLERYNSKNINYNMFLNSSNDILGAFKSKFELYDWLIEYKICKDKNIAKTLIDSCIKGGNKNYIFKKISKDEYYEYVNKKDKEDSL